MLDQNGFGDDCPETAGLSEANNGCDEVDDENEPIAHDSSYSRQKPPIFAEIRIRQGQVNGRTIMASQSGPRSISGMVRMPPAVDGLGSR